MSLFGFLLPIGGFISCYGMVCVTIYRSQQSLRKHNPNSQIRSGNRSIKIIAGLITSLILCYTPLQVYHLLRVFDIHLTSSTCKNFRIVFEALIWLLPAINPIFYSFFAQDFRQRLQTVKSKVLRIENNLTYRLRGLSKIKRHSSPPYSSYLRNKLSTTPPLTTMSTLDAESHHGTGQEML